MSSARALRRAVEATVDRTVSVERLAELISASEPDPFVTACVNNRISGLAHPRVVATAAVSDVALEPMRHEHDHAQFRHLRTVRALARIIPELTVPVLVVKGPVLASHWYQAAGVRGYGDLDLLVAPKDLRTATTDLEGLGFEVVTRNWGNFLDADMAEIQLAMGDVRIDLHWHLQPVGELRRAMPQRLDDWFDRSILVSVAGTEVRTLGPEDTLLHVALHGALSGGDALVYLTDIRAVIDAGVDWDHFAALVAEIGGPGCVLGILERAAAAIHADIPAHGRRRLAAPTAWAPVFAATEQLPRRAQKVQTSLRPRRLLMGGRSTWRATAAAVARFSWRQARARLGQSSPYAPGGELHYETRSGGPDGRDRYFDHVEAQP